MTEIVYVFTNPAMPGYVKIGKTSKANVEERLKELSNPTGIPVPFECLYAAEVADATKVETAIHKAFDCDRPNKKREFFTTEPERIITLLEAMEIANVTPATDEILDRITSQEDKEALAEAKTKWKFSELDISPGVELVFRRDTTKKCRVANDIQVEYEGDLFSLVTLAKKLVQEKTGKEHVNVKKGGLLDFLYEHHRLACRCKPNSKIVKRWKKKGWQTLVEGIYDKNLRRELQDIAPIEPTKEDVPKLRIILTPKIFNSDKRAALLEILAELEIQD